MSPKIHMAIIAVGLLSFSVAASAQTNPNAQPTTPGMAAPNNPSPGQGQPGTQGGQGSASNNAAHERCQRMTDSADRTKCLNELSPSAGSTSGSNSTTAPNMPGGATSQPGGSSQ